METTTKRKWLSISTSRNDGDMVETFVRANAVYIDKFIIMDDSTDGTREICNLLNREGFDIKVLHKPGIVADQKAKTNWMFQRYADPRKYSAVVPLDIDEILISRNPSQSVNDVKQSTNTSLLDWLPFVPNSLDPFSQIDPFHSGFLGTSNTQGRVKKVIISSGDFSKGSEISIGAHNFRSIHLDNVSTVNENLALAHFPIRSQSQVLSKVFTGLSAVRLKKHKAKGESIHLVDLGKLLFELKFQPELRDLQVFAALYGYLNEVEYDSEIVFNGMESLLPKVKNRYSDLGRINLNKNLFDLLMELTDTLVQIYGIKKSVDKKYFLG